MSCTGAQPSRCTSVAWQARRRSRSSPNTRTLISWWARSALSVGDDRVGEPGFADHHDRVQVVRAGLELLALGGRQRRRSADGRGCAVVFHMRLYPSRRGCRQSVWVLTGRQGIEPEANRNGRNKFNQAWLDQHRNDPYVKLARKHGYRARAAFKLIEILDQDKLLRPGMTRFDWAPPRKPGRRW